ncbi:hypothetical protein [Pseudomonas sp. MS15a(2019)]|uniref:hypothetical protein n=1 Tax=Pseudomonas sp. MS15a(2019) TaxID=2579938 RepID=UPI0015672175|nr:hypothetical protein [Pseudomonas sp. MS15a(2019)]NRH40660.1 hypothetical protein [Pseudomonas sp. MS15a(2019)]
MQQTQHYYHTVFTLVPEDQFFMLGGGIISPKKLSPDEAMRLNIKADGLMIRVIEVTEQEFNKIERLADAGLVLVPYGAIRNVYVEPKIIAEEDLQW